MKAAAVHHFDRISNLRMHKNGRGNSERQMQSVAFCRFGQIPVGSAVLCWTGLAERCHGNDDYQLARSSCEFPSPEASHQSTFQSHEVLAFSSVLVDLLALLGIKRCPTHLVDSIARP